MSFLKRAFEIFKKLFVLVAGIFCIWITFDAFKPIMDAHKAKSWPTTTGVITFSKSQKGCGRYGGSYYPVVQYRYESHGTVHVGSQIAFGGMGCGSQDDASEVVANYRVGHAVKVYTNPQNPDVAVIMVGSVLSGTWFLVNFFAFLAILFLVKTVRYLTPRKAD